MMKSTPRDTIPIKKFSYVAIVDAGEGIKPVNARYNVSGFELVEPTGGQQELFIAKLLRQTDAYLMHVTQRHVMGDAKGPQTFAG